MTLDNKVRVGTLVVWLGCVGIVCGFLQTMNLSHKRMEDAKNQVNKDKENDSLMGEKQGTGEVVLPGNVVILEDIVIEAVRHSSIPATPEKVAHKQECRMRALEQGSGNVWYCELEHWD